MPDTIQAATADYRSRGDWFGTWLEWAADHAGPGLSDTAMRKLLESRGFRRVVREGRVSRTGLRVREETPG